MNVTFETSNQMSLWDTPNAISSPASVDGPLRSDSQAGPMIAPSGPDHALANLSARQAEEMGLLTSGTFGRTGSTSSTSADLQAFLVSRLQARLPIPGSTLYRQTWKPWVMPSGRRLFRLRASVHRTSETGLGGWPTARANVGTGAKIPPNREGGMALKSAAMLAGWPTPTAQDCSRGNGTIRPHDTGIPLPQRVGEIDMNQPARFTASGEMLTGSSAGMESGGQLSPEHSRFLMGYPPQWNDCAPSKWLDGKR